MKYKNFLKPTLGLFLATLLLNSCDKAPEAKNLGDAGTTIVKFYNGGGLSVKPLELNPIIEDLDLAELRRDANSQGSLNSGLTVSFANSQALLDEYNAANGSAYEFLPADAYTITTASGVQVSGDTWTVNLAPGEFARTLAITLDKSKLDFSKSYAFAFELKDAGTSKISAEQNTIVVNPIVKNQYHGVYHAAGVFHHPVAGDRPIDEDKSLVTAGLTSVRAPLGDLGGAGYYMILNVNADNTVTISPSGATPNIDQHWGANYYDPVAKAFHLHYSYNTAAPRIVEETITLK